LRFLAIISVYSLFSDILSMLLQVLDLSFGLEISRIPTEQNSRTWSSVLRARSRTFTLPSKTHPGQGQVTTSLNATFSYCHHKMRSITQTADFSQHYYKLLTERKAYAKNKPNEL